MRKSKVLIAFYIACVAVSALYFGFSKKTLISASSNKSDAEELFAMRTDPS